MTAAGERRRVLHVIDSLAGSGGAENRLVDEVVTLGGRFDQRVVRLFERDFLQTRLESAGIPVVALGFSARNAGRSWPLAARRLRGVLRHWRPDVVHTSLFTGNLVGQLACRPLGIPVLSSFNRTGELDLQRAFQPGAASWRGRVMQAVARRVSRSGDVHYRAVSEYARRTNCSLLGLSPERVTVVPRGVSVDAAALDADRVAFGLPPRGPLFVNVARLVPEKGQRLLVDAFAGVRAALPDAILAIAGAPGPAETEVRAAIAHRGLGDAVHLLGFRSDARSLMAAADVFVLSSLSEGSPGVVLEAMAVGTPVVGFDIPPVAELTDAGRYARLAVAGHVPALIEAMLDAYRSPQRAADVAAGRAWVDHFSLAAVADGLGDLLERRALRGAHSRRVT
ncbi:MAG: glycosyltransferase [Jiangellaceae bacterium]